MDQEIIKVEELTKTYHVPIRGHGLVSSFKSLLKPVYSDVTAVDKVSFKVNYGDVIGFIGPNGAGKTTTLKMLSGLLYPTSGDINVCGFKPFERKAEYLRQISMIMGNKSQLNWNVTVLDSFYIISEIYGISNQHFKQRLDELIDLLNISELLTKLPRNLSLGERAKCEFVSSLLYNPRVLFLDEPTLGMDVSIQFKIRDFIKDYNKKYNTTIILTSHYMADISSLCSRVILINKGKLVYDGNLTDLSNKIAPFKLLKVTFSGNENINIDKEFIISKFNASVVDNNDQKLTLRVKKEDISSVTTLLINNVQLVDLTIEDPPIEAVIDQVYREGV